MKQRSGFIPALEIGIVLLVILAIGAGLFFTLGDKGVRSESPVKNQGMTNSLGGSNLFPGKIIDSEPALRSITGLPVLSDEGCQTNPKNGLSDCTSGIKIPDGSTVYFNYEHDMMVQPCLSQGDIVSLQENANGTALVTRTSWGGGGASHQ